MPSFLSKVFGRKKDEKEGGAPTSPVTDKQPNVQSLLDGKYEAISPTGSPTAVHFSESARQPKDTPLALFRSKSRNVEQPKPSTASEAPAPHLTLDLTGQKETNNRALGVVFEAVPGETEWLSSTAFDERVLSPVEASLLVQACSRAIVRHGGLDTLGLMYPHWYAASPEVQQKLISLFLLSVNSISTLAPTVASVTTLFETELNYTRSVHDIAAVLRWALRHLRLEGVSFGKDASEWGWYATFAISERKAGYPPAAFSQTLAPLLPPAHLQLLTATLDIISSLAAHAETTGLSGSKLTKLFGLWIVSAQRAKKDEDWAGFYKRWERAGRILEHLFLSHVREEVALNKMPLRLSEMVKQYPYGTNAAEDTEDLPFLARPRFSTRRFEALLVQTDTELLTTTSPRPARKHPLRVIAETFSAVVASDAAPMPEVLSVWEEIRTQVVDGNASPDLPLNLTSILDEETIRLLSLEAADQSESVASPLQTSSPPTASAPVIATRVRRRSSTLGIPGNAVSKLAGNGQSQDAPASPTDWADFSKLGFGESSMDKDLASTLVDTEVQITSPPPHATTPATWGKKRRSGSPARDRRSSVDNPRPTATERNRAPAHAKVETQPPRIVRVDTVTVDETFFDFWSDALLDPIASDWPPFVVCQLKSSARKYNVLVIEQTFSHPVPPPLPPIPQSEPGTTKRPSSPRPSVSASTKGRRSFNFSPTMKRFSLFSGNGSASDVNAKTAAKKGGAKSTKSPQAGEMGEILSEEDEPVVQPKQDRPAGETSARGLGITVEDGAAPPPPRAPENEEQDDLPAVPLVDRVVKGAPSNIAPATIAPIKAEQESPGRLTISNTAAAMIADATPVLTDSAGDLPPAPETVVLTGSTPGPQTALDTSEPAAIAQASATDPPVDENSETELVADEPPAVSHDVNQEIVPAVPEAAAAATSASEQAAIAEIGTSVDAIPASADVDQTLGLPTDAQQTPMEEGPSSTAITSREHAELPTAIPAAPSEDKQQPQPSIITDSTSVEPAVSVTGANDATQESPVLDHNHVRQSTTTAAERDAAVPAAAEARGEDTVAQNDSKEHAEYSNPDEATAAAQVVNGAANGHVAAPGGAEPSAHPETTPSESLPGGDGGSNSEAPLSVTNELTANGGADYTNSHGSAPEDKNEQDIHDS